MLNVLTCCSTRHVFLSLICFLTVNAMNIQTEAEAKSKSTVKINLKNHHGKEAEPCTNVCEDFLKKLDQPNIQILDIQPKGSIYDLKIYIPQVTLNEHKIHIPKVEKPTHYPGYFYEELNRPHNYAVPVVDPLCRWIYWLC